MENEEIQSMITILARTDALFSPVRNWKNRDQVAGIFEARHRFAEAGTPIIGGGGEEVHRKAHETTCDRLEASGDVIFTRKSGKRVGWKLSDGVDWKLRRLASYTDWWEVATLLVAIAEHERVLGHPGIPETWLIGLDYENTILFRTRIDMLEAAAAPGLCRGWLDTHSDSQGRVAFFLTPKGREYLASPTFPDMAEIEPSEEANDFFFDQLTLARADLLTVRGQPSHVVIPLSCGLWPEDSDAARIPAIFTKGTDHIRSLGHMEARDRPQPEGNPGMKTPQPPAPAHLDATAAEKWRELVANVDLAHPGNADALGAYCAAFSRWVAAEAKVAELGLIIKTVSGLPAENPYLGILKKSMIEMSRWGEKLGIVGRSGKARPAAVKPMQGGSILDTLLSRSRSN